MDAFSPAPPDWTVPAVHALRFCCPACGGLPSVAQRVWLNRRSPVLTENYRRKWQEFYDCECGSVWWAWSDERPPSELNSEGGGDRPERDRRDPSRPSGPMGDLYDPLNPEDWLLG